MVSESQISLDQCAGTFFVSFSCHIETMTIERHVGFGYCFCLKCRPLCKGFGTSKSKWAVGWLYLFSTNSFMAWAHQNLSMERCRSSPHLSLLPAGQGVNRWQGGSKTPEPWLSLEGSSHRSVLSHSNPHPFLQPRKTSFAKLGLAKFQTCYPGSTQILMHIEVSDDKETLDELMSWV